MSASSSSSQLTALAAALCLTSVTPARAASPYLGQLWGAGGFSCKALNEAEWARQSPDASAPGSAIIGWSQGFITGINNDNAASGKPAVDLSAIKPDALWSEVRAYCFQFEREDVANAAMAFIYKRYGWKVQH